MQVLQELLPQLVAIQPSSEAYCKLCSTCAQLLMHLLHLITQGACESGAVLDVFIDELLSTGAIYIQATLAGLSRHVCSAPLQPFSLFHATIQMEPEAQSWTRAQGSAADRHPYICDVEPLPGNSHSILGWLVKVLHCMHHLHAEHMSQASVTVARLLTTCLPVCPVQHLQAALSVLTSLLDTPGQHQSALKAKNAAVVSSCQAVLSLDCSSYIFGPDSSAEALAETAAECWLLATAFMNNSVDPGTVPSAHAQAFAACSAALQRQQTAHLLDMAQYLLRQAASFEALLGYIACLPAAAIHRLQHRDTDRTVMSSASQPSAAPQAKVRPGVPAVSV